MTLVEVLEDIGIPYVYGRYKERQKPPYINYLGAGQNVMPADDTFIWTKNNYMVEYYFTKKDETKETAIEQALLSGGFRYSKSEDTYIESEDLFVIYYEVD